MKNNECSLLAADSKKMSDEALESALFKLESIRTQKFLERDLTDIQNRAEICYLHPMLESRYFIDTDEASDFCKIVYDYVIARKSGLYCTGEFRVGKTKAIQNTIEKLRQDAEWAAIFYHSATRDMRQTKKAFCLELLRSFGQEAVGADAATRLERFLITEAVNSGSRTCVVFIDEAQMLTVMQLRYLLEIWNGLRAEGFLLITILVGQKNLVSLKQLTSAEDHGAVIARFFVKGFSLGGLHSPDDLRKYMIAFDSILFFPFNSLWSYSRFFRQQAFDSGWRLESEYEILWKCLVERAAPDERMLRYSGFRLAFVNDAIHSYFLDSMRLEANGEKISPTAAWKDAVMSAASSDLLIADGKK